MYQWTHYRLIMQLVRTHYGLIMELVRTDYGLVMNSLAVCMYAEENIKKSNTGPYGAHSV